MLVVGAAATLWLLSCHTRATAVLSGGTVLALMDTALPFSACS